MTKAELTDLLIQNAKSYRLGCKDSLARNTHMHDVRPDYMTLNLSQNVIDAILVDYINFVAYKQCMDLGLYTTDLTKETLLK